MENTDVIGKHLLVGITFLDADEKVAEQYQTHGIITSADDLEGIVIEKADGTGSYAMPPGISNLYPAEPGAYRIRTTGEIVVNPDFTSRWTVYKEE